MELTKNEKKIIISVLKQHMSDMQELNAWSLIEKSQKENFQNIRTIINKLKEE